MPIIKVNSRDCIIDCNKVDRQTVCRLAGFTHDPDIMITYRDADQFKRDGALGWGAHIKVKDGTVFNVTKTGKR